MQKKDRLSNFELLRIISMLLIVMGHFFWHGEGVAIGNGEPFLSVLLADWTRVYGKLGVDVFVLLSGYFLINQAEFKYSKLLKIWGQIFFYSIVFYLIAIKSGHAVFNLKELRMNLMPITYQGWWFASAYFFMFLVSPIINISLRKLTQETYQKLLVIFGISWSVFPTVLSVKMQSNDLLWFLFLYSVAAYIRLHVKFENNNKSIVFVGILLIVAIHFAIVIFGRRTGWWMTTQESLPIFLMALILFIVFINIRIETNYIINYVASTTFGIYLIHDNKYVSDFWRVSIFDCQDALLMQNIIWYWILVAFVVFGLSFVIDLVRKMTVEKIYFWVLDKILKRANNENSTYFDN